MKKIDRDGFLNFIGSEGLELFHNFPISRVTSDRIEEFKIRRKYLYRFNSDDALTKVHENLQRRFLDAIPLNDAAVAFRKERCYLNFLEPHRSSYYFARVDLKNFFHSISDNLIEGCFKDYFLDEYFDENKSQKLLQSFINLITYKVPNTSDNETFKNKVILPIGFKTSPTISNIVFRKIDLLIQDFCYTNGISYSRYADDMLFSTNRKSKFILSEFFHSEIKRLVSVGGFKINPDKTILSKHTISLNGYVIENRRNKGIPAFIRVSNKKTAKIEKLIHEIVKGNSNLNILTKMFGFKASPKHFIYFPPSPKFLDKYCKEQVLNKLLGYRSFLISILNFDKKYSCVNADAKTKYHKILDELNKQINIYSC